MFRHSLSTLLLVLVVARGCGLEAFAQSKTSLGAQKLKEVRAFRVERPPRLDGTLDDPLWLGAQPIADFKQREPYEGAEPTEKTEVRILYDSRHLYIGIFCYDSEPRAIVATQLRRDLEMYLDDNFQVLVDPNLSRRNGYVFEINPLGTQRDGLITEEQRPRESRSEDFDPSWDGVWISAARINDRGWTATLEIPFSTLNFKASSDVVWGINFRRFIRRKNEEDLWSAYRRIFGMWRVSQAGELEGLHDIEAGRLLIVKPYALGGAQKLSEERRTALHTGGLDFKYGLGTKFTANLTFNTDFADADVDQQQFNLTPYRLFFPEKRQFFLENSDIFEFRTYFRDLLFFSRQVGIDPVTGQEVPLDAGAKVAGRLGGFELGLMDVKTRASGPNPYANYSVVRVKRPLFGNSYVGVMGVNKESGNVQDPFNRAGGIDGRFVFSKDLRVRGYYAKTWSSNHRGKDYTAGARLEYQTNWLRFAAGRATIQPNYNPAVGFVERADDRPTFLDLNLTPRPRIRGVRELNFDSFLEHHPDTRGALQTQEWQATFRALFNNGAFTDDDFVDVFYQRLDSPFKIYKNISIPPGRYRFVRHQVSFGSPEDRRLTVAVTGRWGAFYTGTLNEVRVRSQYRPNARLSLALTNFWNGFRLPEGRFDVDVAGLQVSYAFSRFLNASTFFQVNTADHEAASVNFRIRYTYRPDSDLYVIYNVGTRFRSLAAENPEQLREQRFAVKLTYSFSL